MLFGAIMDIVNLSALEVHSGVSQQIAEMGLKKPWYLKIEAVERITGVPMTVWVRPAEDRPRIYMMADESELIRCFDMDGKRVDVVVPPLELLNDRSASLVLSHQLEHNIKKPTGST